MLIPMVRPRRRGLFIAKGPSSFEGKGARRARLMKAFFTCRNRGHSGAGAADHPAAPPQGHRFDQSHRGDQLRRARSWIYPEGHAGGVCWVVSLDGAACTAKVAVGWLRAQSGRRSYRVGVLWQPQKVCRWARRSRRSCRRRCFFGQPIYAGRRSIFHGRGRGPDNLPCPSRPSRRG